jgi:arylsulfatase A-like enzyme
MTDRLNVLLIVFDTARADAFEPYGAGVGASPAVAQLARKGTALPLAYTTSNWTLPSHVSMLSGLLPRATGLTQAPGGKAINCRPYVEALSDRLLPEVLRRSGYDTRAASANAWISSATGFGAGFNEFHDVWSQRQGRVDDKRIRGRAHWLAEGVRRRSDDGAMQIEALLENWLGERSGRPFFWFVNLVECHSPYLPPRPYNDMRLIARMKAAEDVRKYQGVIGVWRACAVRRPIPASALARMRHLYGRSIRSLDDWLARLLERMDEKRVLDDTLVIVTSDHGENLGEANLIGHSFSLDQRLIHVPWIMAGPGVGPLDRVTSLIDMPQTVADLVGLQEHPWHESRQQDVVVSQYDRLTDETDPRVAEMKRQYGFTDDEIGWFTTDGTSATDGMLKLIREKNSERAYDLLADPLEASPLPRTDDPGLARLRAALDEAERQRPIIRPAIDAPQAGRPDDARENADLEERLRLLGYIE